MHIIAQRGPIHYPVPCVTRLRDGTAALIHNQYMAYSSQHSYWRDHLGQAWHYIDGVYILMEGMSRPNENARLGKFRTGILFVQTADMVSIRTIRIRHASQS